MEEEKEFIIKEVQESNNLELIMAVKTMIETYNKIMAEKKRV